MVEEGSTGMVPGGVGAEWPGRDVFAPGVIRDMVGTVAFGERWMGVATYAAEHEGSSTSLHAAP
ncbi:hypothetical protein D0T12_12190 [Actinomadura spongiicola]|uniref:Uncharacterized protein n=1 Tax=Actinomadura spongiicola TaxID=2303421 RepID=A0A372GK43_9ACTN|nr:hypothetical protein D0T12_12190 [Actinomadura spongiicola]